MTYRGHIKNGTVVLDEPVQLPEGAAVEVNVAEAPKPLHAPRSLYDALAPVVGRAQGLPADGSLNHDHYLYGVPKRA